MTCNYKHLLKQFTRIAFAITVAFSMWGFKPYKKESGWDEFNLYGKVKSFKEISYKAIKKMGKIEKGERSREEDKDDFKQTFDLQGRSAEGFIYNDQDVVLKRSAYTYNTINNISEIRTYNTKGVLVKKIVYGYDDDAILINHKIYVTSKLRYLGKKTFQHDNEGRVIEMSELDHYGNESYTMKYTYDAIGNVMECNKYQHCMDGSLSNWRYIYKYDVYGNVILCNSYDSESDTTYKLTYKYKYDDEGNWLTKTEFIDNVPTYIFVREFEYYD